MSSRSVWRRGWTTARFATSSVVRETSTRPLLPLSDPQPRGSVTPRHRPQSVQKPKPPRRLALDKRNGASPQPEAAPLQRTRTMRNVRSSEPSSKRAPVQTDRDAERVALEVRIYGRPRSEEERQAARAEQRRKDDVLRRLSRLSRVKIDALLPLGRNGRVPPPDGDPFAAIRRAQRASYLRRHALAARMRGCGRRSSRAPRRGRRVRARRTVVRSGASDGGPPPRSDEPDRDAEMGGAL